MRRRCYEEPPPPAPIFLTFTLGSLGGTVRSSPISACAAIHPAIDWEGEQSLKPHARLLQLASHLPSSHMLSKHASVGRAMLRAWHSGGHVEPSVRRYGWKCYDS